MGEAHNRKPEPLNLTVGDVVDVGDRRLRIVCFWPEDSLRRVGVRNVETNRLSYIPIQRLLWLKHKAAERRAATIAS